MTVTDPDERARRIAYHDSICDCADDISTYPTPPDGWKHDGDPVPAVHPPDSIPRRSNIMTEQYTKDDFKRARFADPRNPHIAGAYWNNWKQRWELTNGTGSRTVDELIEGGWVPVPAGSYTRTDEDGLTLLMVQQQRDQATARAVKAEQALAEMTAHRDQCRDTAIKWQMEANRAGQARALTPDDITDAMVERGARQYIEEDYTSWERSPALAKNNARESVRGILEAALTEPPHRPEGAAELHQVLDAIYQDEPGITHRGNLADMLATYGVRVASVGLTPANPEEEQSR